MYKAIRVIMRNKYTSGIVMFLIIAVSADEVTLSKTSIDTEFLSAHALTKLKSLSGSDGKKPSKRLAFTGSANNRGVIETALSSSFRPIINNYLTQQPPSLSSARGDFAKLSPLSASNAKHPSAFVRGPQLTYSTFKSTAVPYIHNPFQFAQQIQTHQLPAPNHYSQPSLFPGYPNSHHFSYSNQFQSVSPQEFAHQKPQPFSATKQHLLSSSKPHHLEALLPPTSTSEVHHNSHGAISYVNFSLLPSFPVKAQISSLVSPNHDYQQPQTFYSTDQKRPSFYPLTFAQSIIPATNFVNNHEPSYAAQPYARITKISETPAGLNHF